MRDWRKPRKTRRIFRAEQMSSDSDMNMNEDVDE